MIVLRNPPFMTSSTCCGPPAASPQGEGWLLRLSGIYSPSSSFSSSSLSTRSRAASRQPFITLFTVFSSGSTMESNRPTLLFPPFSGLYELLFMAIRGALMLLIHKHREAGPDITGTDAGWKAPCLLRTRAILALIA